MGVILYCLSLFCMLVVSVNSRELTSLIKPCRASDPKLNECALKSANLALPGIFKSVKKLGIPSFDPYLIPLLEILNPSFTIKLDNIKFWGLDDATLRSANINEKNHIWTAEVIMDRVNLVGHYIANGKIANIPFKGDGISNTTFVGGVYNYSIHVPKVVKDGVEYYKINSTSLNFKLKRAHFYHGNLFEGNQQLGEHLNNFFNENWELVLEEMGGAIKKVIEAIGISVISKIFENVPANKILLP